MKAVIFDLDGVLVDSQPLHYKVDVLVLKSAGIDCGPEVVHKYAGIANRERWPKYIADYSLRQTPEELSATHVAVLDDQLDSADIEPMPHTRELLEYLRDKKIRMAVASSSSLRYIEKVLSKTGMINYFESISSGEEVPNGKPAPDVFLLAVERLGISADDCVIIEDSANGVAAAKSAGIKCIGYVTANSGEQDLSKADKIIDSFNTPETWLNI